MILTVIIGVFVINIANGLKSCENCIKFSECPQALKILSSSDNEKGEKMVKEAICGSDSIFVKICCSDFTSDMISNENEIENHLNLYLLPEECGVLEQDRIIGGEIAQLYEFPWMVLLGYRDSGKSGSLTFFCGGTLINARYVLTAAHCIRNIDITVRVGEYDTSKTRDCQGRGKWRICETRLQDIPVSHKIKHPAYQRSSMVVNDIALLRLREPVDLTAKNAGTICLPVFQNLLEKQMEGEVGTVAGWGQTEDSVQSSILRKVDVPILSVETCEVMFGGSKRKEMEKGFKKVLCAGETDADTCKGDSGGPLMVGDDYNNTYKYIQYGIVSSGISCGRNIPALYTDVRKYMKWILDTMKP